MFIGSSKEKLFLKMATKILTVGKDALDNFFMCGQLLIKLLSSQHATVNKY